MTDRVIEIPVINAPYQAPQRHYRFDSEGVTSEIAEGRRPSEFLVPVPQTKKAGAQLQFDNTSTAERIKPNEFINKVWAEVNVWCKQGYPHTTPTSRCGFRPLSDRVDTGSGASSRSRIRLGTRGGEP